MTGGSGKGGGLAQALPMAKGLTIGKLALAAATRTHGTPGLLKWRIPGGIVKAAGLGDGPWHRDAAIAKLRRLRLTMPPRIREIRLDDTAGRSRIDPLHRLGLDRQTRPLDNGRTNPWLCPISSRRSPMTRRSVPVLVLVSILMSAPLSAEVLQRQAGDTLTAVEMNQGDTLRFTLADGAVRTLALEDTSAEILERNQGGIVYAFQAKVRLDGHPLTMLRYVGTQESFYEPCVVNGMRIWFDCVLAVFDQVPMRYPQTGHRRYRPRRAARFAVQDATLPICPEPMQPWYPNDACFIDVGTCYNGDDCWMGAYLGEACHGGMDINQRRGGPLWAPLRLDDQWNFNSLRAGDNNNRWRGIRRWANGDVWVLQTHHHLRLLVPEHTPLAAGTHYAEAAGVHVGSHDHTHYEFKIAHQAGDTIIDFDDTKTEPGPAEQPQVIHLDPWIVFWQIFETAQRNEDRLQAAMQPLRPVRTGAAVPFHSATPPHKEPVRYHWTFGDGGGSDEESPRHVYARPGIYAVTLMVVSGNEADQSTQLLTVDGAPLGSPVLTLDNAEALSFLPRPAHALDVYGARPRTIPHTLTFLARPSRPRPDTQVVQLRNAGGGTLAPATVRVAGGSNAGWLTATTEGDGNTQRALVSTDARDLAPGRYTSIVEVACPGAANAPQRFTVVLVVPDGVPKDSVIVDDRDEGFSCTPYFWVGHRFSRCKEKGYHGFYRTNGGRTDAGQFARFTPDLAVGRYRVALRAETPYRENVRFRARVHSAAGDEWVDVQPQVSRVIGSFDFHEGSDGFVEFHAAGSSGLLIADAVEFTRISGSVRAEPKPPRPDNHGGQQQGGS